MLKNIRLVGLSKMAAEKGMDELGDREEKIKLITRKTQVSWVTE